MNTSEPSQNVPEHIAAMLPRLRRFARHLTRDVASADDLVQDGIERALRHAAQWNPEARFDSWMFRIVRNAWIDEIRARARRERVFAPAEAGEAVGIESMEQEAALLSVQAAFARLPDEQREAVSLVLVEGLPYKEAAEVLEIPIGTLTSRLARGRAALQSMLGGDVA